MKVLIPTQLHSYTGGASQVSATGASLAELLDCLNDAYPGIRFRIVDEQDRIREHIRIFVSGKSVKAVDVPISDRDEVQIVGALSGG